MLRDVALPPEVLCCMDRRRFSRRAQVPCWSHVIGDREGCGWHRISLRLEAAARRARLIIRARRVPAPGVLPTPAASSWWATPV